ncbi:MAG: hypothetical protein NDI61_00430 [Bdellovibrionaceae bacterium]|nr:hypothetical protein [Pseudobdellovibrionaceae bacterium]
MTQSTPLDSQKLEAWLRQLETALADVSVIDRSDILMEIHAHIRDSYDRGGRTLDDILSSLGEPTQVANRFRLERGMQPVVVPRAHSAAGSFFKWATIGVLGFLAIMTLGGVLLVSKFFPLIQVDEKENRVRILGGLIDIQDDHIAGRLAEEIKDDLQDDMQIHIGGRTEDKPHGITGKSKRTFKGEFPGPLNAVTFSASNGELQMQTHEGTQLEYNCQVSGGGHQPPRDFATHLNQQAKLDFSSFSGAKCQLSVPVQSAVRVEIANGDVKLTDMRNPVTAKLDNGRIVFGKHPGAIYKLNTKVINGVVSGLSEFESAQATEQTKNGAPKGELYSAELEVTNGGIRIE